MLDSSVQLYVRKAYLIDGKDAAEKMLEHYPCAINIFLVLAFVNHDDEIGLLAYQKYRDYINVVNRRSPWCTYYMYKNGEDKHVIAKYILSNDTAHAYMMGSISPEMRQFILTHYRDEVSMRFHLWCFLSDFDTGVRVVEYAERYQFQVRVLAHLVSRKQLPYVHLYPSDPLSLCFKKDAMPTLPHPLARTQVNALLMGLGQPLTYYYHSIDELKIYVQEDASLVNAMRMLALDSYAQSKNSWERARYMEMWRSGQCSWKYNDYYPSPLLDILILYHAMKVRGYPVSICAYLASPKSTAYALQIDPVVYLPMTIDHLQIVRTNVPISQAMKMEIAFPPSLTKEVYEELMSADDFREIILRKYPASYIPLILKCKIWNMYNSYLQ